MKNQPRKCTKSAKDIGIGFRAYAASWRPCQLLFIRGSLRGRHGSRRSSSGIAATEPEAAGTEDAINLSLKGTKTVHEPAGQFESFIPYRVGPWFYHLSPSLWNTSGCVRDLRRTNH